MFAFFHRVADPILMLRFHSTANKILYLVKKDLITFFSNTEQKNLYRSDIFSTIIFQIENIDHLRSVLSQLLSDKWGNQSYEIYQNLTKDSKDLIKKKIAKKYIEIYQEKSEEENLKLKYKQETNYLGETRFIHCKLPELCYQFNKLNQYMGHILDEIKQQELEVLEQDTRKEQHFYKI